MKVSRSLALLFAAFAAAFVSGQVPDKKTALPARVLLIRHAEKPGDDSIHLSSEGKKRADELYHLFEPSANRPDPFPTPDVIFAARQSKHSNRSVETVSPLASRLKLTINTDFRDEEFAELAHEVLHKSKYAGKTILICWHHGMAPQLAVKLGAADAPPSWKSSVFDRVWQISYDDQGKAKVHNRPQRLLDGDAKK
jgi:hypothetical protein